MPIYEFYCPNNHRIYSFLAKSLSYASKVPRCPENPKWKMEKLVSSFAITGRNKETADGADVPKMEAAMAQMEREFGSMADTDNPDPRALAKMMRRMGEIAGQKIPGQMEEMLSRLERGEDPDKLEAEYGDSLDGMEGDIDSMHPSEGFAGIRSLRRQLPPRRDPKLYDMSEFAR